MFGSRRDLGTRRSIPARVNGLSGVDSTEHDWTDEKTTDRCRVCRRDLFQISGFKCTRCGMLIHQQCMHDAPQTCSLQDAVTATLSNRRASEGAACLKHNFHIRTFWPPTYCATCGKLLLGVFKQVLYCKHRDCHMTVHNKYECIAGTGPCMGTRAPLRHNERGGQNLPPLAVSPQAPLSSKITPDGSKQKPFRLEPLARLPNLQTPPQPKILELVYTPPRIYDSEPEFQSHYEVKLDSNIAQGSFGSVFLCEGKDNKKVYAVKIIFVKNYGDQTEPRVKLDQELELLCSPNIHAHWGLLGALAAYRGPSKYMIVMPLCESHLDVAFWRERLLGTDMPPMAGGRQGLLEYQMMYIMYQIVSAVQYLHSLNPVIVHRDLKPQNILVNDSRAGPYRLRILVADFGVAREMRAMSVARTVMGSDLYRAPEVVSRKGHNHIADLWSIGGIMFTLSSGQDFSVQVSQAIPRGCSDDVMVDTIGGIVATWTDLTAKVRDMLRGLLMVDPKQRLNAESALAHPWFYHEVSTLRQYFPRVNPPPPDHNSPASLVPTRSNPSSVSQISDVGQVKPLARTVPASPATPSGTESASALLKKEELPRRVSSSGPLLGAYKNTHLLFNPQSAPGVPVNDLLRHQSLPKNVADSSVTSPAHIGSHALSEHHQNMPVYVDDLPGRDIVSTVPVLITNYIPHKAGNGLQRADSYTDPPSDSNSYSTGGGSRVPESPPSD